MRKRIEATESARTFEYTIQFESRAAKYFTDAAALEEKLALVWPEGPWKKLEMKHKEFADQLSKSNSEMTKFLGHATADDLLGKPARSGKEYLNEILSYTCSQIAIATEIDRNLDISRSYLFSEITPNIGLLVDKEKADATALSSDCSSELAISLMKERAGKRPSN